MKVICIRFTSGEEVIGKLVEGRHLSDAHSYQGTGPWEPTGNVVLSTVRGVTFQPMGKNQVGIAFIPFAIGNTDVDLMFKLDNCAVAVYPPSSDLEKGYLEQTTGISLAAARPGIQL